VIFRSRRHHHTQILVKASRVPGCLSSFSRNPLDDEQPGHPIRICSESNHEAFGFVERGFVGAPARLFGQLG
jgi:hypothetical protein